MSNIFDMESFIIELKRLKKAEELLSAINSYINPYTGKGEISDYYLQQLNDFYEFDDSE